MVVALPGVVVVLGIGDCPDKPAVGLDRVELLGDGWAGSVAPGVAMLGLDGRLAGALDGEDPPERDCAVTGPAVAAATSRNADTAKSLGMGCSALVTPDWREGSL